MKSGKVLSVSKVVMLPPAGVRGLYNLIAGSPRTQERGDAAWSGMMCSSCSSSLAVQLLRRFKSRGQSSKRSITIRNDRPQSPNVSGHSY